MLRTYPSTIPFAGDVHVAYPVEAFGSLPALFRLLVAYDPLLPITPYLHLNQLTADKTLELWARGIEPLMRPKEDAERADFQHAMFKVLDRLALGKALLVDSARLSDPLQRQVRSALEPMTEGTLSSPLAWTNYVALVVSSVLDPRGQVARPYGPLSPAESASNEVAGLQNFERAFADAWSALTFHRIVGSESFYSPLPQEVDRPEAKKDELRSAMRLHRLMTIRLRLMFEPYFYALRSLRRVIQMGEGVKAAIERSVQPEAVRAVDAMLDSPSHPWIRGAESILGTDKGPTPWAQASARSSVEMGVFAGANGALRDLRRAGVTFYSNLLELANRYEAIRNAPAREWASMESLAGLSGGAFTMGQTTFPYDESTSIVFTDGFGISKPNPSLVELMSATVLKAEIPSGRTSRPFGVGGPELFVSNGYYVEPGDVREGADALNPWCSFRRAIPDGSHYSFEPLPPQAIMDWRLYQGGRAISVDVPKDRDPRPVLSDLMGYGAEKIDSYLATFGSRIPVLTGSPQKGFEFAKDVEKVFVLEQALDRPYFATTALYRAASRQGLFDRILPVTPGDSRIKIMRPDLYGFAPSGDVPVTRTLARDMHPVPTPFSLQDTITAAMEQIVSTVR